MRDAARGVRTAWEDVDLGFARTKNLTPYDVLIIASMIEEEVLVPKERPLVAAVIYNRLKLGMTLGIDATIRYGLGVPPTESLRESQLADPNPYNTRIHTGLPPTPITNPGLAVDPGGRPSRRGRLPLLRAEAGLQDPLLHGLRGRVPAARRRAAMLTGATRARRPRSVDPVADSLSPRMQNAAFAALGLDWAYVPLPVEAEAIESGDPRARRRSASRART